MYIESRYDNDTKKYVVSLHNGYSFFPSVSIEKLEEVINTMDTILSKKDDIINFNFNISDKIYIFGEELDVSAGVCQFINLPDNIRFYIGQEFKGSKCVVYPVEQFRYDSSVNIWRNPRRWEYVQHVKATCEDMIKLIEG